MADILAPARTAPSAPPPPRRIPPATTAPTRSRRVGRSALRVLRSVLVLGALAGLWELAPRAGWVDPSLVPPLSEVGQAWWDLLRNGQLWDNTQASLRRAGLGFTIAVLAGVPLGILIGWYRSVHQLLDAVLGLLRDRAALALITGFALLLGIGAIA